MIDVALLKKPLDDLAATLGTGQMPATDPMRQLTHVAGTLNQVSDLGLSSARQLEGAWRGHAADAAVAKGLDFGNVAGQLATHGQSLGFSWLSALESVLRGVGELAAIGASFMRILQHAETLLAHPLGQLTLLKEALDHLSRALDVVIRLSSELSSNAGGLNTLGADLQIPTAPGPSIADQGYGSAAAAAFGAQSDVVPANGSFETASASGGGAIVQLPDGSIASAPTPQAADAVRNALSQRGVPYVWGGTTPGAGFDCSGLTQWSYAQAGIEIPRLAQEQNVGTPVRSDQLMAGDLAVWDGHVAMVIGNGQMVEAGNPVSVSQIRTDNMGQAFYGFYRPTS
ncbi:C40 family peptidase [Hoyosella subflava]|uniref:NPL/P60-family secreted protein n=1 Tax=Hoyosella subflava (strain DSM 45089 / JCM 17490 / NBRC 109087 / DQS3-9A1) TaxID=443218 RepID=F6EGR5_HOYSD|nr:C40 family peptidase [Hoyosella subflava]AEF42303.1 NPL/P60-family secreted protein [Hoyosella subflava DQS3-9A1]